MILQQTKLFMVSPVMLMVESIFITRVPEPIFQYDNNEIEKLVSETFSVKKVEVGAFSKFQYLQISAKHVQMF